MAKAGVLDKQSRSYFLNEFRTARLAAQNDAEAFDKVLFVVERFGSFLNGRIQALGNYEKKLLEVANMSPLASAIPALHPSSHSDISVLFKLIRLARNDAQHQGARARHLTTQLIRLAIVFEDALMNGNEEMATLSNIMVQSVVLAEDWQPLSLVRQTMLENSFSYLPIRWNSEWKLVGDYGVASFLGSAEDDQRKERLALSVRDAIEQKMRLETPLPLCASMKVSDVMKNPLTSAILVFPDSPHYPGEVMHPIGIITAFDLL